MHFRCVIFYGNFSAIRIDMLQKDAHFHQCIIKSLALHTNTLSSTAAASIRPSVMHFNRSWKFNEFFWKHFLSSVQSKWKRCSSLTFLIISVLPLVSSGTCHCCHVHTWSALNVPLHNYFHNSCIPHAVWHEKCSISEDEKKNRNDKLCTNALVASEASALHVRFSCLRHIPKAEMCSNILHEFDGMYMTASLEIDGHEWNVEFWCVRIPFCKYELMVVRELYVGRRLKCRKCWTSKTYHVISHNDIYIRQSRLNMWTDQIANRSVAGVQNTDDGFWLENDDFTESSL